MPRPNKPWFRASKGTWYATVNGKKVSLGVRGEENAKGAHEAWHKMMAGVEAPQRKREAEQSLTVGEVVSRFLADCEGRVKPETLRWYRDFLQPFVNRQGKLNAADLTPTLAEAYSRKPEWSASTRYGFLGTIAGAFKWAGRAR